MHIDEYVHEVEGLDTDSRKRLVAYCANLKRDKRSTNCDKRVLDVIREFALSPTSVDEVMRFCSSKRYTQAWYRHSLMEKQLQRFAGSDHTWFGWNKNYKKAKDDIKALIRKWNLRSLEYKSEDDIREAIPRKDTHAGWQYILSGRKTKGENLEGIFVTYMTEVAKAKEKGEFEKPILYSYRTQTPPPFNVVSGEYLKDWLDEVKCKTRLVSMIDLNVILAESVYAIPFQRRLGEAEFYAGGKDDSGINSLVQTKRWRYHYWLSLDYSAYDQTISSWLIEDAFEIMREAFIYDPFFDGALWEVVKRTFIHKVFVNTDVSAPVASHKGVPSGSMFTQIVDTIVNLLMIRTYLNSIGCTGEMIIMGDDNIIFTHRKLDSVEVASYLVRNFGIECNATKCSEGCRESNPEFLSRFWTPNGAWRHPNVLLAKMTHPERFRNYNDPDVNLDPVLIVYAYILSFPVGMRELINIDKFKLYNATKLRKFTKRDLIHGSGSMRYRILYNRV